MNNHSAIECETCKLRQFSRAFGLCAVFYKWADYAQEPLSVFYLWQGGMSFHGGLIGAIMAIAIYARRVRAPFLRHTDLAALLAAPGLGLGRLGNFIGGELPGRVASSDLPWAMIYRHIDELPRQKAQLYQAFIDKASVLTAIMQIFPPRKWRPAADSDESRGNVQKNALRRRVFCILKLLYIAAHYCRHCAAG